MATQEKLKTIKTTYAEGVLTLLFPRIGEQLQLTVGDLSPDILEQATIHGLKQKLVDAAAISRDTETGKSATDLTKFEAVKEVFDRITGESPMWNALREGGDGSASMLVKALVRYHAGKKTRAEVEDWLGAKSDTERKALRANPKIAAIIVQIMGEQADDAIDSDSLLNELDD